MTVAGESRRTDPCIWPLRPIPAMSRAPLCPTREPGRWFFWSPPTRCGMLLGPAGVRVIAGIFGRSLSEDRAALVDRQRLGARGADVDSQGDTHNLTSQALSATEDLGNHPAGQPAPRSRKSFTGTVLKVNIS